MFAVASIPNGELSPSKKPKQRPETLASVARRLKTFSSRGLRCVGEVVVAICRKASQNRLRNIREEHVRSPREKAFAPPPLPTR